MYLLSSKYLTYPFISGIFMHNGLIQLVIYPIKYVNELFLPYGSFLDITVLSISTLSMSIKCLCLWNAFY